MVVTTHTALEVDAEGAVDWAAAHPGFFIFPGRLELDDSGTQWRKRPWVRWTERASSDPDAIRAMWNGLRPECEGRAVVFVACAPSNVWILDKDSDLPDDAVGAQWKEILDTIALTKGTLVLRSCTKGQPHYVFRQGADWVAEGRWIAGDVKSSGIVVISSLDPMVDAPIQTAPKALLDRLRLGRPKGSHGRGACTREELWDWLASTPDPEALIVDPKTSDRFIETLLKNLDHKIDEEGAHRRMACLDAVYQGAIEAMAGCYPAESIYLAIKGAYRMHREARGETGDKGWSHAREVDFDLMWQSLIPSLGAGDHDDKIEETRAAVAERYEIWNEPDEEIERSLQIIIDATREAEARVSDVAHSFDEAEPGEPADDGGDDGVAGAIEALADAVVDSRPRSSTPVADTGVPASTPRVDSNGEILPESATGVPTGAPPNPDDDWGLPASPAPPKRRPVSLAPILDEAALWGPHGDLVDALRGRTESSDVGILGALLAFSGAAMAGRAHWKIGADVHGPNDYFLNIGASSAARKSSGLGIVNKEVYFDALLTSTPGGMFLPRKIQGIASGEKLVKVWEPILVDDPSGGPIKVEEWPERRTLMVEAEASVVWKRGQKDGSILSDTMCLVWDQGDLSTRSVTTGDSLVPAERHLLGFIGCSTMALAVSAVKARDGADAKSGFANRFIWLYLPDSGIDLPHGADLPLAAIARYQDRLGLHDGSLASIGGTGFGTRAAWGADAHDKWSDVYGTIKRDKGSAGFIEAMLSRAESHVLRLALNYWLAAGGDPTAIGVGALDAALALWSYSKASVEFIFGSSTGNAAADNLMDELASRGGWATMEELRFDLNKNTLASLVRTGVEAGVMVEGTLSVTRPGRPPRAVALTQWLSEGRLAPTSTGAGRGRGLDLSLVRWNPIA